MAYTEEPLEMNHMHYLITSSLKPGKQLTSVQRNSSMFSEAPRIGGKTLRRGQSLTLKPEQFAAVEARVYRLHEAGAIDIFEVDDDGEKSKFDSIIHGTQKLAARKQLTATQGLFARASKKDSEYEEMVEPGLPTLATFVKHGYPASEYEAWKKNFYENKGKTDEQHDAELKAEQQAKYDLKATDEVVAFEAHALEPQDSVSADALMKGASRLTSYIAQDARLSPEVQKDLLERLHTLPPPPPLPVPPVEKTEESSTQVKTEPLVNDSEAK